MKSKHWKKIPKWLSHLRTVRDRMQPPHWQTIWQFEVVFIIRFILLHNSNKSIITVYQYSAVQNNAIKNSQNSLNRSKTAGAVMLLLALRLQKRENFSVISVMLLFTKSQLCHFTNQAQGDRRGSKVMNFTKKLILCNCIAINTKCKGFLMKLDIYINF